MRRSGAALFEVMVALSLLAGALVAIAALFGMATRSNRAARDSSMGTILAAQKMEQLRSLAWAYGENGSDETDVETDLSVAPEGPGGSGLSPSPAASLLSNTMGFVDYLDDDGKWVGTGVAAPMGAVYVRRWSIEALVDSPLDTLVVRVLVVPLSAARSAPPGGVPTEAVCLTSVRSRRAR